MTNRFVSPYLLRGLLLACFCLSRHACAEISVVDDAGNTVTLARPAQRVIALAPHLTEMMFAVGAGDRLIGQVSHSEYPAEAKNVPLVGDNLHVDLERVIALKPDLLVVWLHGSAGPQLEALRKLGIPLYYSEPHTLEQIEDTLLHLGRLVGSEKRANQVVEGMRDDLHKLSLRYARQPTVRVFYQVWDKPLYTLNGKHFVSDVIRLCGGENIFSDLATTAPVVSVEAVLQENPEVIISGDMRPRDDSGLQLWHRYPTLMANRRDNLFAVDPDLLVRPGPRIVAGATAVCENLAAARARRAKKD
ncbi:MAG TPA: cobalamin-binding protein [Burkholderiaceae bacterium]|jgi:iron complex transport system substrate-binding protein